MDKELHNYTIAVVPAGLTAQMKHVKGVNHASTASRFGKKNRGEYHSEKIHLEEWLRVLRVRKLRYSVKMDIADLLPKASNNELFLFLYRYFI